MEVVLIALVVSLAVLVLTFWVGNVTLDRLESEPTYSSLWLRGHPASPEVWGGLEVDDPNVWVDKQAHPNYTGDPTNPGVTITQNVLPK
jgi:hypothetical protein